MPAGWGISKDVTRKNHRSTPVFLPKPLIANDSQQKQRREKV